MPLRSALSGLMAPPANLQLRIRLNREAFDYKWWSQVKKSNHRAARQSMVGTIEGVSPTHSGHQKILQQEA